MRKKTYLSFKDLRAFYDGGTGKLRLTSGDPRLASKRWGLTLDRDTYEKAVLEQQLVLAGITPERDGHGHREVRVLAGCAAIGNAITVDAEGSESGSLGPYIGRTSDGTNEAVFYSPLANLGSSRMPLCMISGAPGAGKSFAALRIVDGLLQQGATVVHIDPKGDALPYAAYRDGSQLLDLRKQPAGLLNPFELEGEAERIEAVMDALLTLLGGERDVTFVQRGLLSHAILEAMKLPRPSLSNVMHQLSGNGHKAQALFDSLNFLRNSPFAHLIFQSSEEPGMSIRPGFNLITMLGLDLPYQSLAPDVYSNGNRLGAAIYRLAHLHALQSLRKLPNTAPKVLVADEGWLVTITKQDVNRLRETVREGRVNQLGTILIAHDPADFNAIEIDATRMFFRQRQVVDVSHLTRYTSDPDWQNEEQVRHLLAELRNGECLMEDGHGRRATVQISGGPQYLRDAFSGDQMVRARPRLS